MNQLSGLVHVAMIVIGSVALILAVGVGIYFYYTASGQEEGE